MCCKYIALIIYLIVLHNDDKQKEKLKLFLILVSYFHEKHLHTFNVKS